MSDLEHINSRIEQIRREIESDPDFRREIEQRWVQSHEAVRRAEEAMRSRKVVPISNGRRKQVGEVEL